jgi:hypothetical protein
MESNGEKYILYAFREAQRRRSHLPQFAYLAVIILGYERSQTPAARARPVKLNHIPIRKGYSASTRGNSYPTLHLQLCGSYVALTNSARAYLQAKLLANSLY